MAGTIITITSGKGGVGKTTTTGNLAVALTQLGNHVVCLDLDIGLRNLDLTLGLENRIVYDIVDVVEGRVRWRQALVRDKRLKDLFFLPASQWREKHAIKAAQLVKLCADIREEFDFVLIDCPAGIELGFRNAVAPANQIVIVATPEMSSIRGAARVIDLVRDGSLPKPRLILNRVRPAMVKQGDMLDVDSVLELLKVELLGVVPEDSAVIARNNFGNPVAYSKGSGAGPAYVRIARRLMGESVPVQPADSDNWIGRLSRMLGG